MTTMTDLEMLESIRDNLRYFAGQYPDIGAFQTFYDYLQQPRTYAEFHAKFKTLSDLKVKVRSQDYPRFMEFDMLMINYMYARRNAGDSLTTIEKTVGPRHALLHVETRNPQLLEMRGLLQRLGEMTTVSKHT
jgi:hypothetical protein